MSKLKEENIDWNSPKAVKSKIISAKSAVTRACTAISKLIERPYVYSTPAACDTARQRLEEAYDNCVELHDRWTDLQSLSAETAEAEAAAARSTAESIKTYEEKYFEALKILDGYIDSNSHAGTPSRDAPDGSEPQKLNACKLLFPETLSKSKTPEEFRMWMSAFRRFFDASGLEKHNAATQQGYLLRGLEIDLRKVIELKITTAMKLYGAGGCMDVLEEEFRIIYPLFSRRVDFFQLRPDTGEDVADYLHFVVATSDMADLEAMNKEDLAAFQFIASCADSRLRDKLFKLKRKDLTTVNVVVEQHARQLKAETTLAGKQAPIAAVNCIQNQTPAAQRRSQPRQQHLALAELKGRCAACGDPSHRPKECHMKKNGTKCSVCGKPGHLAKVCFTVILDKIKNKGQGGDKPVRQT